MKRQGKHEGEHTHPCRNQSRDGSRERMAQSELPLPKFEVRTDLAVEEQESFAGEDRKSVV